MMAPFQPKTGPSSCAWQHDAGLDLAGCDLRCFQISHSQWRHALLPRSDAVSLPLNGCFANQGAARHAALWNGSSLLQGIGIAARGTDHTLGNTAVTTVAGCMCRCLPTWPPPVTPLLRKQSIVKLRVFSAQFSLVMHSFCAGSG